MAKHTLRNLSEEQNIVPRSKPQKAAPKTSLKPFIVPIISVAILLIFTLIANYHTYFKDHFFVTAEYLHVRPANHNLTTFCLIIIFPLALGVYAFIRSLQKRQRTTSIICGIALLVAIISPFLTSAIFDSIANIHADQTMLAIEMPDGHTCSLVGFNNRDKSDCPDLTHITFSAEMPEGIFIPIKDNDNYLAIYLDEHKTINNFDQQNIKVCAITPSTNQIYRCHDLKYSATLENTDEDEYYTYIYTGNKLIIKSTPSPSKTSN